MIWGDLRVLGSGSTVRRYAAAILGLSTVFLLLVASKEKSAELPVVYVSVAACLAAAGVAALAARHFSEIESSILPEVPGLGRGARVVTWILILIAVSVGLEGAGLRAMARVGHIVVVLVNGALGWGLLRPGRPDVASRMAQALDIPLLSFLGGEANPFASVFVALERHVGLDLRSTWALSVVRQSLHPLAVGLALLAWVSTGLTVVAPDEQGLIERLGVPVIDPALDPGLHGHWPWPIDRVVRIPVRRIQRLSVGHDAEGTEGPENVLWAREHAVNEYTLLLGDGRDLITIDAAAQFRIQDARAWQYGCANPLEALRSIAYRAVMTSTVSRSLTGALSENVMLLTERMREQMQRDADGLGLGVEVLAFTVGGMHPPVMVAEDYQAVASAEIGKSTSLAGARAVSNQMLPAAEAAAWRQSNAARAEAALALAKATGEAWSFRILEAQYRAEPAEYLFRRRLEELERKLAGRRFWVVDERIERDGGSIWLEE